MWTSTFLFLLYFLTVSYVFSDGTYECGDHGKFEYCIDEIPGCVIGCHCHPGYYFDTDTKICEPNSKLIEHHRRHYADEQTSVQSIVTTPFSIIEIDSVKTSKINSKVDEISKDANDLGDWLYNQFFKTIENQVINNTSDKDILTRRSGSRQAIDKPKKKKVANKGKQKQKKKKQNLKKKLLRITENDSLFDMTSRSDSDSSDDSSSDSSFEYERRDDHHDSDDEHGHKKIVMINKKPKPALPSFIFLPNMDTPFYPPIGLPPPPVVPMYPIVPVPPVVPFCVTTDCINDDGKTTSSPSVTTTVTTESEVTKTSSAQNTDKETLTEINEPTINTSLVLRLPGKKKKKESRLIENDENNDSINNFGLSNLKPSTRQKFLKRLKERMSNPSAKFLMSPWKKNKQKFLETFVKDRDDNEASILENALLDDSYLGNNIHGKTGREDVAPENVDFKYITELIHKVDLKNKSNDLPPIEYSPSNSIEMYQPQYQQNQFSDYIMPPNAPDSRRYNRPSRPNQQSEDSYYMKLGREIASMIRGIDEQNREVTLKLEGSHDNLKNALYFNENSPRSYWERSVRSPLTFLKSNKSKFEYLKKSNELLFDIENKVEIVASTRPTLSLQEIENIVKVMENTKKEVQRNKESSNKNVLLNNLNIKLWPQELREPNKITRNSVTNNLDKKQIKYIQNAEGHKTNEVNQIRDTERDTHGIRMHNVHRFVVWRKPTSDGDMKPDKMAEMKPKIKPEVKSYLTNPPINYNKMLPYEIPNNKQVKPISISKDNFRQSLMEGNMGSFFLKHRKYFDSNQNYFVNPPGLITRNTQPSYFHHEIDHFDYVD